MNYGFYYADELREGSLASIWRYRPTPESSDGAGEDMTLGVVVALGAPLVCDTLRTRLAVFEPIAGRVLVFHSGLVTVTLEDSSRRETGVAAVLRLAGRATEGVSPDTRRVPNLALAEDSRP